ncbi:MAG: adenylate/guanylate cyclase domain-containing protein [Pseudomonadota bacterium]
MSIEAINEQLLRAIGAGVALVDPGSLEIRFHNETFSEWFDEVKTGARLSDLLEDLDLATLRQAIEENGRYDSEATLRRKRRRIVVALSFTRTELGLILLEGQNITRIRELETMIETYSAMVERNTREIEREKERVEKLLLSIMPRNVYEEYKAFGVVTPQSYDPVTVLSIELVDFDVKARDLSASVLVSEINDIFASFDRIGEQFNCERIKTVGDAYVAVCGLPEPIDNHAASAVGAAVRFIRYLSRRAESHDMSWQCRVGLASGPVIGSVVGVQRYVYDVFGPAVNIARSLRSLADPMQIVGGNLELDQIGDEVTILEEAPSFHDGAVPVRTCRLVST